MGHTYLLVLHDCCGFASDKFKATGMSFPSKFQKILLRPSRIVFSLDLAQSQPARVSQRPG